MGKWKRKPSFTRDNGQKKISSFFSAVAAPEREGNTVRDKDSCHEKVGNKSEYFMTKGVSLCNTEHSSDNDDKFKKEKKNRSHVTPKKSNSGLGKMKTVSSPEDSSMFPESSVDSDLEIIECTPGAEKCNKPCSFSFKNNMHSPEVVPSTPLAYKTQTMSVTLLGLDSNLKNQNKLASTSINIKKSSKVSNSPIKPGSMQVKNKIVLCKLSRRNKEKSNTHNCTNQNENHENLECKDDLINKEPTSVKRAAVSGVGISPDPKRTVGPEGEVMDDEVIRCKTDLTGKFDSCIPSVCNAVKSENLSIQQTNEIDRENDESFSLLQPSMKLQQNKTLVSMVRDKETQKGHFKFVDNVLVEEKNLDFPVFPNLGKGSLEIKERISCKSSKYIDNSTVLLENENEVKNLMERNLKNVCGSLESHDSLFGGSFVSSQGFVHVDDSVGHKPENKQVQSVPETQENYLCDSSLQYMFDDELALDFDKMSPFKQQIKEPTETAIENKQVKKLLAEGMGSESFASQGNYGRYVVTSVERDAYKGELLMQLTSLQDKSMKSCTLSGFWSQSVVSEGDVVHILFTHPVDGHFSIDNKKGLIVINPDFLISGTSVVSAVFCRRKAVLNERFKGLDSNNQLMLIGSLIHQLFQEVVKNKIQTHSKLDKLVQELMSQPTVLRDMYGLGVSEAHIYKEMNNFIPHIHAWSQQYLGSGMARSGKDQERGQRRNQWNGEIVKIQDIEENMWSPKFGVKGKIDLTVKTHQHGVSKVMPLELKTGKSSFSAEHRGQVTLYSMMSADRRQDPRAGLLLYLKDGAMEEVPAGDNEKRGLIQLRNDIIHYLRAKPVLEEGNSSPKLPPLPEPIDFERACTNCAHLLTCSVYQKSSEESLPEAPHAMATLVPKTTAHLTQIHLDYFRHWCLLLHLEIANGKRDAALRALWCQDATKRETHGDCLSLMMLERRMPVTEVEPGQFVHAFTRSPTHLQPTILANVGLQVGDNIVVSSKTEIALSLGVIFTFEEDCVRVVLDRNLKLYPNWQEKIFSVDRCEYQNTMSINFTNLAKLLMDTSQASHLRGLLIDRNLPLFKKGLSHAVISKGKHILKSLNKSQQRAVLKTLMAESYILLKGYPGTGKTSTIVSLVRLMVSLGLSVLLTSYTHTAVDNILLKLKMHEVDFLRLGRISRIHSDLKSFADEIVTRRLNSVSSLSEFYQSKLVVATTCLGINHVLFSKRTFDFCIIDEASQVLQVAAFGPLFHASRFVLVGDPQQLPPVVQSKQAKSLGMSESLFMRLDSQGATLCLTQQYRMNGPIMKIANQLMYDNQLQCASPDVESATVHLPHYKDMVNSGNLGSWLQNIVEPSLERSVIFLDTCKAATEAHDNANVVNSRETQVVVTLVQAFIQAGLSVDAVGVITPFRAQVKQIRDHILKDVTMGQRVEVNTVDQYQGRDKDVIVYSCVRSGVTHCDVGDILQDERRLNVAVTRAKYKLIMVGDAATLHLYPPFRKLKSVLQCHQIYQLKDGQDDFVWQDALTS